MGESLALVKVDHMARGPPPLRQPLSVGDVGGGRGSGNDRDENSKGGIGNTFHCTYSQSLPPELSLSPCADRSRGSHRRCRRSVAAFLKFDMFCARLASNAYFDAAMASLLKNDRLPQIAASARVSVAGSRFAFAIQRLVLGGKRFGNAINIAEMDSPCTRPVPRSISRSQASRRSGTCSSR